VRGASLTARGMPATGQRQGLFTQWRGEVDSPWRQGEAVRVGFVVDLEKGDSCSEGACGYAGALQRDGCRASGGGCGQPMMKGREASIRGSRGRVALTVARSLGSLNPSSLRIRTHTHTHTHGPEQAMATRAA
jgi:hypothetical protein